MISTGMLFLSRYVSFMETVAKVKIFAMFYKKLKLPISYSNIRNFFRMAWKFILLAANESI